MEITQINRIRINESLYDLRLDVEKGIISHITPSNHASEGAAAAGVRDAEGLQYLPATTDMHIHLDKHFWASRGSRFSLL